MFPMFEDAPHALVEDIAQSMRNFIIGVNKATVTINNMDISSANIKRIFDITEELNKFANN